MKIMIVEDHADMRRVLRKVISGSNYESLEIIECESGEDAIRQYSIYQPDCVLMDIELQTMSGFHAVSEIQSQDKGVRVVFITSYDTPTFKKKAEKLKAFGFISKDNLSDINPILQTITTK